MKDLYKLFQLNKHDVNDLLIKSTIKNFSTEHQEIGRYILLHKKRKEIYDRTHNNLALIGKLRSELKLTNTEHWCLEQYADFTTCKTTDRHKKSTNIFNGFLTLPIFLLITFLTLATYVSLKQNIFKHLKNTDSLMQVSINALNMRAQPSIKSKIITVLHKGQHVHATKTNNNKHWLQITTENGKTGYVSAQYLVKEKINNYHTEK